MYKTLIFVAILFALKIVQAATENPENPTLLSEESPVLFYRIPSSIPKDMKVRKIDFAYDELYVHERNIVYEIFKKRGYLDDEDYPHPILKEDIGIYLYDINDDGHKEIFVYLVNGGYCGSLGCHFEILSSHDDVHYVPVYFSGSLTVGAVFVSEEAKTNGLHDIIFDGDGYYAIWKSDGLSYQHFKTIITDVTSPRSKWIMAEVKNVELQNKDINK